jgi:hypothetical protein
MQRVRTERSLGWQQNVDRPRAWALEHLWLLEAVFAAFDRDGEWPKIEAVQRRLADSDPSQAVAVSQLAIDIPNQLGARQRDRLTLTTQGLVHCQDAARLLSAFVAVIRQAAIAYRASDDEHPAVLSGYAVKESVGLDDPMYVKVSQLVFREPWFFGSGGGNFDEDWHFDVRAEVLLAENIESINDYLDVVTRYRFGPSEIESQFPGGSKGRLVYAPRDWLTKRDLTVRDLLLVAIVGAVIAGALLWLLFG